MREVAALAGVSVKTVSNVVNDYPHIRHATRARVEDAIDALGYHVNETARGLRRGRTGAIGLTIPELGVPYFAELANSVVNAANARGLSVLIELTGGDRERELEVITRPRNSLVDGLIFSPLGLGMEDKQRLETDYPIVLLGERIFGGPTDHVTMANVDGARLATEFLLARGARRIALLGAHPGETVGSACEPRDTRRHCVMPGSRSSPNSFSKQARGTARPAPRRWRGRCATGSSSTRSLASTTHSRSGLSTCSTSGGSPCRTRSR